MQFHLLVLAATAVTLAGALSDQRKILSSVCKDSLTEQSDAPHQKPEHFWPHARGPVPGQYGLADVVPPENLSANLAWSWHHPDGQYHTTVAGGPVIDRAKNLYLTASDGIRKFSPEGKTLWHFKPPGDINNMPALMGDYVYGNTQSGHAFALDQETGEPLWTVRPSNSAGGDSGYPAAYDGLFVMGTEEGTAPGHEGGNNKVIALDGNTGEQVWEYRPEHPVWNVMPLFPGDGTCVFMDFTGGVYRVGLHNGTLLWHSPSPGSEFSFSDGGVILGSNKVAYACSNPGANGGGEGSPGVLRAFQVSDGKMLWEQFLPQPCNSWPAVGHLVPDSPELSVVITPGSFMGTPTMHGGIMAFDASTGKPQWQYQAPVYHSPPGVPPMLAAYGDYQGVIERSLYNSHHAICLPAHWSAPSITADGAIYAGRSDGKLYIVRGQNATLSSVMVQRDLSNPQPVPSNATLVLGIDYPTSLGVEVDVFDAKGASLHGATAFAPGMMAFATCDTLYTFKFDNSTSERDSSKTDPKALTDSAVAATSHRQDDNGGASMRPAFVALATLSWLLMFF